MPTRDGLHDGIEQHHRLMDSFSSLDRSTLERFAEHLLLRGKGMPITDTIVQSILLGTSVLIIIGSLCLTAVEALTLHPQQGLLI
jgi:hypothetical protein